MGVLLWGSSLEIFFEVFLGFLGVHWGSFGGSSFGSSFGLFFGVFLKGSLLRFFFEVLL